MALNHKIKENLDLIRDYLNGGGFPDPLSNAEQLSYLFFFNMYELVDANNKLIDKNYKSIFSGKWKVKNPLNARDNSNLIDKKNFKWSIWKNLNGNELVSFVRDEVFPFYEDFASKGVTNFMNNSRLGIDEPVVLSQIISKIDDLNLHNEDPDTKGDLFEYVLKQIKQAGELGQFRTPRHIIDFIVKVVDPKISEKIYDPAAGTAGFLVSAFNYIKLKHSSKSGVTEKKDEDENVYYVGIGDKLNRKESEFLYNNTFYGNDVDGKMVRLATMNLTLRNLNNVKIIKKNPLTQTFDKQFKIDNQIPLNGFEVILANPPFKGSIDSNRIVDDVKVGDTKKTQILFIKYILNSLKKNGRAAIVVPDGVLFDTEFGFEEIRRQLLDKTNLHTIVSLPKGVFEPYSGVKTSILFFTINEKTKDIMFVDVKNDGFKLDSNHDKPINMNDLPLAFDQIKNRNKNYKRWVNRDAKEVWNEIYVFATIDEVKNKNNDLSCSKYFPQKNNSSKIFPNQLDINKNISNLLKKINDDYKKLNKVILDNE